jgi:hypothetical protein
MTDYLAEEAAAAILACRGIGADHRYVGSEIVGFFVSD